jgi:starch synthase
VWDIDRKYQDKDALRDRFWLRKTWSPVVAYVGRLDEQKDMHLVPHALFYTLAHSGQFVLLGDANHHNGISSHFCHLKRYLNDNPDCHLEIGYQEELAHLVYAGADLLVVPSMFEPCGLAPMTAMRYGTVPVVRAIGGMTDTVFDATIQPARPGSETGTCSTRPTTVPSSRPRARPVVRLSGPVPPAHGQLDAS